MSPFVLMLAAALPAPPPPDLPAPAALQEPPPEPERGEEEVQEPPAREAFEKLSSAKRKKARAALAALKGGRTPEARAEGEQDLRALGEGVVPMLLGEWQALDAAERGDVLRALLEELLPEDALHLAWAEVAEGPGAARAWVVARWDASDRKDTVAFLAERLADAAPEAAYAAGRGLLRRGDPRGWEVVAAWIGEHWTEQSAAIRADFRGLERGPLAARAAAALDARKRADRLAGLRLFELFGAADDVRLLLPALSESDTTLRLAAIDAARASVDGDAPLERPSMTAIIQRAEAWKKRIRETGGAGGRR